MRAHNGTCGYLRLAGHSMEGLEQARNAGIDQAWLQDQIPQVRDLSDPHLDLDCQSEDFLALIEQPRFRPAKQSGLAGGAAEDFGDGPLLPSIFRICPASASLIELLWLFAAIDSFSAASSTSLFSRPRSLDSS